MSPRRALLPLAAALLTVLVAACSSGGSGSSSTTQTTGSGNGASGANGTTATVVTAGPIDPCALLTPAQVATAIARPVGTPTTIKVTPVPPNGAACVWTATATQGELVNRTARVDAWSWSQLPSDWKGTNPSPRTYVERICSSPDAAAQRIDIPGFVACRSNFIVYVANDSTMATVGVPNLANSPEAETAAIQLAKDVAARL